MRLLSRHGRRGALLLVSLAVAAPLSGQTSAAKRLAAATSAMCTFRVVAVGSWKNGEPQGEIKPATLSLGFDTINADEGTARVIGAFGPSEIIVRLSTTTLHFLQSSRDGPLYTTSIFPKETRPGRFLAVHTRHEYTEVSLPGFTSRPEQYYGDCEVKP